MYYRDAAAAAVVYDITSLVRVSYFQYLLFVFLPQDAVQSVMRILSFSPHICVILSTHLPVSLWLDAS